MNKSIILVLAAALSFAVNAREIQIDLGNFPARNCIQFNNPSESPVGSPRYSTRSSRVTGTVLLETINQRDESIVMRCAEQAKAELMESFSPSNTEQFGMVFEKYIDRCARSENPKIRIILAFINQKESCKDNF